MGAWTSAFTTGISNRSRTRPFLQLKVYAIPVNLCCRGWTRTTKWTLGTEHGRWSTPGAYTLLILSLLVAPHPRDRRARLPKFRHSTILLLIICQSLTTSYRRLLFFLQVSVHTFKALSYRIKSFSNT